jgi:hypothetical protein
MKSGEAEKLEGPSPVKEPEREQTAVGADLARSEPERLKQPLSALNQNLLFDPWFYRCAGVIICGNGTWDDEYLSWIYKQYLCPAYTPLPLDGKQKSTRNKVSRKDKARTAKRIPRSQRAMKAVGDIFTASRGWLPFHH